MTTPGDASLLRAYFAGPAGPAKPGAVDVAKFILNATPNKAAATPPAQSGNEPSLMGRLFDILSRGNYASANLVNESIKESKAAGRPIVDFAAAIEGLTGKSKTTYKDVQKELGIDDVPGAALQALTADIVLDPTTYLPMGAIAKGASNIKRALKGGEAIEDAATLEKPLGDALLNRGDPIHPESFGLPPGPAQTPIPAALAGRPEAVRPGVLPLSEVGSKPGFTTPQLQLDLPGVPNKIRASEDMALPAAVEAGKAKEVVGQIPLNFKDFKVRAERLKAATAADKAEDIVAKAAEGVPEAVAKVIPPPSPAVRLAKREQEAALRIVENWSDTATAAVNKADPATLNAKQQVKLYYRAIDEAKKAFTRPNSPSNIGRVKSNALKIYSAVERMLEETGKIPRIGTGHNMKLSDVMRQAGTHNTQKVLDDFAKDIDESSGLFDITEGLKAQSAVKDGTVVADILNHATEMKKTSVVDNSLSTAEQFDFDRFLKKWSKTQAKAADVSTAGVKATQRLMDLTLNSGKTRAQIALEGSKKALDDVIATGKANLQVNHTLTHALEKDLGKLPKWVVNNNNAVEMFMGRMATWWGQKDLRPLSLNAMGSSQATAAVRGQYLDKLFKGVPHADRLIALRSAQEVGNGTHSTPLAAEITRLMDNLVGQVSGSSVLLRSGVTMDYLNKWMRRYGVGFEFTNKKNVKNLMGNPDDFSKGTDWVNSWKTYDIKTKDPKVFLFKMQEAMEQATREKAMFDEMGERFGSQVPGKGFNTRITGHPYIEGYYFPKEIAEQIPRVVKDWSIPAFQGNNAALRHYDRVMSMWKSGVTIYRPGHHIRNLAGDVYLGWMDGVNSLRPYQLAARVQRAMRGAYSTLDDIDKLVELGAVSKNLSTPIPGQMLFTNKSGVEFTAEQIAAVAHQKGLLEHTSSIEDIIDMGDAGRGLLNVKPFGGRIQGFVRGASELESHNTRLAHFIDKVAKSRGDNLPEIFEAAARRARKWHPTSLDLTDFEKKYLRRVMPFYSWMRKSLPLLLEGLVMNPGKSVVPAKIYDAVQYGQGIDTPGRDDPFPVDQMFPEWIRAQGLGPVSASNGFLGGLSNQDPEGYVMGGTGLNPLTDLGSQLSSPGKTLLTSITPGVGVPIELLSGRKSFTGEAITGPEARPDALGQYVGENIPLWSMLQGITGVTPFGGTTGKAAKSDSAGIEALVNWLTAAGIRGTGTSVNQARFEAAAPGKMERRMGQEELLQQLRDRIGG